jgi:hypothetical protein
MALDLPSRMTDCPKTASSQLLRHVPLANSPEESPRRLQNSAMIPVLNRVTRRVFATHPDAFGERALVHLSSIASLFAGF